MKLTLEEIWKMVDVLEEAQKVTVKGKPILQEKAEVKERVLKLPQLQISENWGKKTTVEREELENIVYSATRGAKDPFSRLKAIQNQMTSIASGEDVKNPQRILSQVILLETLNRLFKSFQPSPAGFINEAFLSVIYGSEQKGALEANAEGDIGDITDQGIPVSLKTLTSDSPHVKGSVANLIASINKNKKVYFDLYLKNSSGGDSPVGELRVVRFVVDATNINQFLQLPENTIGVDTQTGNLVLPDRGLNEGFIVNEQPAEPVDPGMQSDLSPEAQQLFKSRITNKKGQPIKIGSEVEEGRLAFDVLKANDFDLPKAGNFTEFFNNLSPRALAALSSLLQKEPETPALEKLIKDIAGTEISKTAPSKKGLRAEFEIPQSHWSKFARQYGQKQIVLEFSDEKINTILESAVRSIDASITEIFNNLADFTSTLQTYLTSTKSNRGLKGQEAVKLAEKIKPSTEKVVKDEK
jgi:hypothetical protein